MARKNYRVGVPEEKKPPVVTEEKCEIPKEQIIPPAEDVTVKPQVKVMEVATGKIPYSPEDPILYNVRVTHPSLRRRAEPNDKAEILGLITDMGTYGIYKEEFEWGQLQDKSWIMLRFTKKCNNC